MTSRRILVDSVGINGGGGRQVSFDIIVACANHALIDRVTAFVSDPGLAELLRENPKIEVVQKVDKGLPWRAWWWLTGFAGECRRIGNFPSLHLANVLLRHNPAGSAVMIHQPNALRMPADVTISLPTRLRYVLLRALVRRSCAKADLVIVQTDAVRDDLRECLGARRCAEVMVALPRVPKDLDHDSRTETRPQDIEEVLYIGSSSGHKNLKVLVEAGPMIRSARPNAHVLLTVDAAASRSASAEDVVRFLGPQTRSEVGRLLSRASVLVMPSLAETVGLPMLEAMVHNVPVIAADRPYAHAICGDAAAYFDPLDPSDLAQACVRALTDKELREELVARGRRRIAYFEAHQGDLMIAEWMSSR